MKLLSSFTLLGFAIVAESAKKSYDGAKAVRIPVGEDVTPLKKVIKELNLPVWKSAKDGVPCAYSNVDLVVPADKVSEFDKMTANMDTKVMHEDLGASIAAEETAPPVSIAAANLTWFNAYHDYADHLQFLSDLAAMYPTRAKVVTMGASDEGRQITGIHFWGSSGPGIKPAVVLYSTVHAREWITTVTNEYMAYHLLTNYDSDPEIRGFVDQYDYYIYPVVNPDGFVYSQTTDRFWRKNRQVLPSSTCVGRDLNRNWAFHWEVEGGASIIPCEDDYKGLEAGDATETRVMMEYTNNIAATQGVQLYIDIHSYAQLFMTPYGFSCEDEPTNGAVLHDLAVGVVNAISAVYGTSYTAGPVCPTIYPVTGASVDYVNDVTNAKYSFTIELRDTGENGFVLPVEEIMPTAIETWAGLRYLLLNMP
ncbi:uncharacterized protein L3040_004489 [Drepanopeziza brunnea f. sp. 'multigermtubi']|uniref:uncharacterized protein n=1 Tax=Drepanopeziza brunnea f. sp. 'multigermtubi' TaxID=698441 RepID=UPI00238E2ACF|nr:hypothetical protein L3040_004489 [Drepanopeziza brunnea f. sp. 'multigermtubi']